MKTTSIAALAIVLGLVPTLAFADPVINSGALNDAIQQEHISDSIGDAIGGSSGGVYSDPLTDAINGPDVIYSEELIDALNTNGPGSNGQRGGAGADLRVQIARALK